MKTSRLILVFYIIVFLISCKEEQEPTSCIEDEFTIQDIDGNCYQIVQIGDQFWMAENLRTTKTKDGSNIRDFNDPSSGDQYEAYVLYDNDPKYNNTFGKLYNGAAICCGICPDGWRLPSPEDWLIMIQTLGGLEVAGAKLKLTSAWPNNGYTGNNEFGFSAYPASGYSSSYGFYETNFATWWTTEVDFLGYRTVMVISENMESVLRTFDVGSVSFYSVRCIKED